MKYRILILFILFMCCRLHATDTARRMLIVADSDFVAEAEALADIHRIRQGMAVEVVAMSRDATSEAVRLKVKEAYDASNGSLGYVTLYGVGWTNGGGDAYHGMVKGTFSAARVPFTPPAVAVGRIPVSSTMQCMEYNDKIIRYLDSTDGAARSRRIVLAADDGDNLSHQNDAEEAALTLSADSAALIHKIYVGEYSLEEGKSSEAKRQLIDRIETGVGLWVYIGHGDEVSITGEGLMDSYAANTLCNEILPWGFFSSCRIGKFGGSTMSFTEALLFNGTGGVIGCVSSPQEVYASYNRPILLAFARRWATKTNTDNFGDLWLDAQCECMLMASSQVNKTLGLNTLSFNLIGDPALPLRFCEGIIGCEYIDNSGVIVGELDGAADGTVVEAEIYSTDNIFIGKSIATVNDDKFEIPINLSTNFDKSECRAFITAIDHLSGTVCTSDLKFAYVHPEYESHYPPIILRSEAKRGEIIVEVITDGCGISQNKGELGAYSRCVIDGRIIAPLSLSNVLGNRLILSARYKTLITGRHNATIIIEGTNGLSSRADFSFIHDTTEPLELYCERAIVRERAELYWNEAPEDADLILKVSDSSGKIVHRQELGDATSTAWNLINDDSERVPPGTYYCHLVSRIPGIAYSQKLRLTVLPL